jgi:hypothetical protein
MTNFDNYDDEVLVNVNQEPINVDDNNQLDPFFNIIKEDPIERLDRKARESYGTTGPDSNLLGYVRSKIGSEYIISGTDEDPIQIPLSDLNNKQLLDVLRYSEANDSFEDYDSEDDLDSFEIDLINAYRSGDTETIEKLLGYVGEYDEEYTDDEVLFWKLSDMYPDFDESQIAMEIELLKESPNYEYKLNQARRELSDMIERKIREEENEVNELKMSKIREEYQVVDELIDNISHIHNFIVDDDVKNNVRELIFSDNGRSELINLLDTREGLLEIATAYAILPKIAGYVNKLTDEIAELKKKRVVVDDKNNYNSKQRYNSRLDEEVEDVSDFFFGVDI